MKVIAILLTAVLLPRTAVPFPIPADIPSIRAECAILTTFDSEVLYEADANRIMPIASTTKLMTALIVSEKCGAEDPVLITPEMCGLEGSSIYLKPGETLTVRELLLGMLLVSGNDAAEALAIHCAGSEAAFSELMNAKAVELGMNNSHFINPHGLNDPLHYSTARDMALLMRAVMSDPLLADIEGRQSALAGERLLINHNRLLEQLSGCTGGKTGYTTAAGRCLVSSAERDGTRFICVTLSDPDDWSDHTALYEWAFSHFEQRVLSDNSREYFIPLLSGIGKEARIVPAQEVRLLLPIGAKLQYRAKLPHYVFAPVRGGSAAGELTVEMNGDVLAVIPLIYACDYPLI